MPLLGNVYESDPGIGVDWFVNPVQEVPWPAMSVPVVAPFDGLEKVTVIVSAAKNGALNSLADATPVVPPTNGAVEHPDEMGRAAARRVGTVPVVSPAAAAALIAAHATAKAAHGRRNGLMSLLLRHRDVDFNAGRPYRFVGPLQQPLDYRHSARNPLHGLGHGRARAAQTVTRCP